MTSSELKINCRRLAVNRILFTALFLILQIAWIVVSIVKLSEYSTWISVVFRVLSLGIVLFIICKEDNPAYKIVWIILIMLLPIFGGLLYLFAGNKKPSKHMNNMIQNTKSRYLPMLSSYGEEGDRLGDTDPRSYQICRYIKNLSGYPVYANTEAKYYPVGEEMFADMLTEIRRAKHFIFLEYFIIAPGKMWDEMLEALLDRAEHGVEIRIIYDDMGCVALLPPKYYRVLERMHPNIKCLAFNPVVPVLSLVMNNRDHRKILVIDGHTGFNGGINISDEYINATSPYGHWKDTGVMLRGDAVMNLTEMFLELWHSFIDTDIKADIVKYSPDVYGSRYISKGYVQPFYDTPLDREALSENVYIEILSRAEKYVYIYTPYLILDDIMKNALCLAAKRGVDVRLVTPGIPDKRIIYRMTRANYMPLLRAGVRIFEYTPGFIHAKSFVSDDKIGVVGTINLDYRSLFLHFECGTLLYGCDAVTELKNDCLATFEQCREITAANLRQYYRGTMFDALLRLIAPLL